MSPRWPALAATFPLLILGLTLVLAACAAGTATTRPTVAATVAITTPPTPVATSIATAAAASPSPAGTAACNSSSLAAAITGWQGAAGHRSAAITLTNNGKSTCTIPTLATPQLVDANGTILIQGAAPNSSSTLSLASYDVVKTSVQDANYCGAAPTGPVTVAFVFPGGAGRVVATPAAGDPLAGVPPCLGAPGSAGDIEMQPFAP